MKAQTFVIARNTSCFACWSRCNPDETRQRETDAGYGSMRIETIYLDVRNREEGATKSASYKRTARFIIIIMTPTSIVIITKRFCAAFII